MKKILITGISGFAGSFLAQHFVQKESYEVFGTYLSKSSLTNLSSIRKKLHLVQVDLMNAGLVSELVSQISPDNIFHLAALPSPAQSFGNPSLVLQNNITIQLNLLEALKMHKKSSVKTLVVSSGDIYGLVKKEELPINENTPLRPVSPYAVSKIAQDYLGLQYNLSYHLNIVRVRPFNHIGPRQSPDFVVSSFAKKIAEIEQKKAGPILHVGNLEAKRDFTDVRDMVQAYSLLMEKGESGEVYNVGSGISHKISEILDMLLSFSKEKIEVKVDKSLLRPNDAPELICDSQKMRSLTNWIPTVSLSKTLKDTLDYWRDIV